MDDGRHISTAMKNLWIDEVLYLHSLWHQGPRNPNHFSPSPSTSFKKIKKKRRIRSNINTTRVESPPHSGDPLASSASIVPWPCSLPPISDHDSAVGWPSAAALPRPRGVAETKTATAAEQASFVAVQSQHAGVKACQEFFMDLDGGENDDDEEGDSMDDDEDIEGKSKRFEFFLGLLEGNPDLKEYYVKNWEKGEFTCLVCGGMKVKLWRRFVTLVALVQHANTIRRTKTKGAHRDFAKAVCQVLEWDIERLSSLASEAGHLSDGGSKNELGEDGDGDGDGEKKPLVACDRKGDDLQTKATLNSRIE
ncbi:hypothetical protein QJS04_geneDACA000838 [Acorus gramineus]|uniref:Uncharacterized protein n=1 Tax=Acorus gramineus TaxID=55184 RepID=A0AAV9BEH5_ACOGR|nr:hypothetical protein QJS04_geneDACA000838 [Acorus gramineus]